MKKVLVQSMMRRLAVIGLGIAGLTTAVALAQPPGDRPPNDRPSEGDMPPPPRGPEGFVEHALQFDKDGDGKLDREELLAFAREMPPPPPPQERGFERRPDGREGGPSRRPGGGPLERREQAPPDGRPREGRGPGPMDSGPPRLMIQPDRMLDHAFEFDADKNGELNREEMSKFIASFIERHGAPAGRPQEGRPPAGGPPGREEGRPGRPETRRPGSPEGPPNRPAGEGPREGRPEGRPEGQPPQPPPGEGRPQPPRNPERFVEHAMEFDADGDGKLDRVELAKFAEHLPPPPPPPPEGGEGPEGREGPDAGGGEQPRRPGFTD